MRSLSRAVILVVIASLLVAGCNRWWKRGILTGAAGTAIGVAIAVSPCPTDPATGEQTSCGDRGPLGAEVGVITWLALWGVTELIILKGEKEKRDRAKYDTGP